MSKNKADIKKAKRFAEGMRAAGKLAAQILNELEVRIQEGMSTLDIDRIVLELTAAAGAICAPYRYKSRNGIPFPAHCCTSVNEVICHGIPRDTHILKSGDIINVDVTPKLAGYHGDSSRMFCIGTVLPAARRLVETTKECLELGIKACYPNCPVTVIGEAIEPYALKNGFSTVVEYTGHGTGTVFHKQPTIFHVVIDDRFDKSRFVIETIKVGTAFTIEPMLNMGQPYTQLMPDGWTVVTKDGSLSAQWEHTLLMTKTGVEVLTQ